MRGEANEDALKVYPILRKNRRNQTDQVDEVAGKNRKFLEQKQYFKAWKEHSDDYHEEARLKYGHFDLNTLIEAPTPHVLYNPQDYLHGKWVNQERVVNLLREGNVPITEGKGLYVEYERTIN